MKPYSLGELSHSESTFGVEVRFLDDRLIDTLDAWLSWGGVMRLGAGTPDDAVLIASEGQIISQASWEELAKRDQDTAWEIRLVTPTTFSSKGNHVPSLSPATIATSLQQRWWAWNRRLAPPRIDRDAMASVLATQDFTRTSLVSLAMPRNAGHGRLSSRRIPAHEGRLRISGVEGAEATRVFSRLMALSAYTNVGSHTSFGMGVIDAVAA
ncbi:CRISPR system precrRNA processing endoribonuclease RAMP protein Cas6 [Xylanimonas cellulosilytica]|uniref:CRISPR system precrRNA processing endoribonuclease RAMP protein Cas6 n=1 Tax=Xylanimonas cellulosilytica TaxID=186189 RepID=UPI00066085A1|nr:CRISPR system precrRNA processing endoribonuclease RAMP protein Cas6 [Xylanimonas cellulosilytica]